MFKQLGHFNKHLKQQSGPHQARNWTRRADEDGALEARGTHGGGRPAGTCRGAGGQRGHRRREPRAACEGSSCVPTGRALGASGGQLPHESAAWERRGAPGVGGPTQEGPGENTGQRKESWPCSAWRLVVTSLTCCDRLPLFLLPWNSDFRRGPPALRPADWIRITPPAPRGQPVDARLRTPGPSSEQTSPHLHVR